MLPSDAAAGQAPSELSRITVEYSFFATIPGLDPFLTDQSVWNTEQGAVVVMSEPSGYQPEAPGNQPVYRLLPQTSLICSRTGQLYHPASGLLFKPVSKWTFNPSIGRLNNSDGQSSMPPQPDLVYERDTFNIYERTLSLAFSGNQWCLARAPAVREDQQPIRQARVDELPVPALQDRYAELLTKQQQQQTTSLCK